MRGAVTKLLVAAAALVVAGGCARKAATRVYVHGEVEDETGAMIPHAIVRVDDFETVSDGRGHYRLLYLANCLRGGAGIQGIQTPDIEVFARGFEKHVLGFHLDSIELVGGGSCPADTDKYLRLIIARSKKDAK